jgi:glycosyltransferase involved in cell wall biosynthesis
VRILFLIPDLNQSKLVQWRKRLNETPFRRLLNPMPLTTDKVFGGTLNLMRHCAAARAIGADAFLATERGVDNYGETWGIGLLPFVCWSERRANDLCVIPDVFSPLADHVAGPCVVYQQQPIQVRANFDFRRHDVYIWTDSPFMLEICKRTFPGKEIPVVPNIVDDKAFPFIPQNKRKRGELMAFPRKGAEYIQATYQAYKQLGGAYWELVLVDGLPFRELALRFSTPQVFLASGEFEGCALPPQEAMAAGIVVVGKDARGANFCMKDGETALVADTPEEAAKALMRAEDDALRERIAIEAYREISRYFPDGDPAVFYRKFLGSLNALRRRVV